MLTSSPLLNVVTSIPFLSLLLYSVSSTVLTVLVELPSTRPSDDTAAFPWLDAVNFDARRNRKRDFVFGGTAYKLKQTKSMTLVFLKIMLNLLKAEHIVCAHVHFACSPKQFLVVSPASKEECDITD